MARTPGGRGRQLVRSGSRLLEALPGGSLFSDRRAPLLLIGAPLLAAMGLLLLAAIPLLVSADPEGLRFTPLAFAEGIGRQIVALFTGEAFSYTAGFRQRSLLQDLPGFLWTSLRYALPAALVGSFLGIAVALLTFRGRRSVKDLVAAGGLLPDFLLIFALQLGTVWISRTTGVRIARIATLTEEQVAVGLPLTALTLPVLVIAARLGASALDTAWAADFTRHARARGIGGLRLLLVHILPHGLVALRGSLHRLTALVIADLFIAEYLFNLPGVTRLVLSWGEVGDYQLGLVFAGFVALALVYLAVYGLLRLLLSSLGASVVHF